MERLRSAFRKSKDDLPLEITERFDCVKCIGEGRSAKVYKAFDKRNKCDVALKYFYYDLQAAKRESVLRKLHHQNIVRVYDISDRWVAMEFIEGKSLRDWICKNEVISTWEAIRPIALQIARALQYLQRRKIKHRDIKPSNILLHSNTQKITIIDFGIALADGEEHQADGTGTYLYTAPEILQGAKPSNASDVYSFGGVLYFLLTQQHYNGGFNKNLFRKDIPQDIALAIKKMLNSDPCKRLSLKEFTRILHSRSSFWSYQNIAIVIALVIATYSLYFTLQSKNYKADSYIISDTSIDIEKRGKAFLRIVGTGDRKAFPAINLEHVTLKAQQIIGIDLANALFSRANLRGSTIRKSNFRSATFIETNFRSVYAGGVNFQGANFTNADLTGAYMKGTLLKETDFTNAILDQVNFTIAKKLDPKQLATSKSMNDAFGMSKMFLQELQQLNPLLLKGWWDGESTIPSFAKIEAYDAEFSDVRLEGADFSYSKFIRANFTNNHFEEANFIHSDLTGSNFTGANLSKVNFKHANLKKVVFNKAVLDGADFRYTKNLTDKQIQSAKSSMGILR